MHSCQFGSAFFYSYSSILDYLFTRFHGGGGGVEAKKILKWISRLKYWYKIKFQLFLFLIDYSLFMVLLKILMMNMDEAEILFFSYLMVTHLISP